MARKQQDDLGEVILYRTEDGGTALDVRLAGETVWLTLNQIAELFGRDKSVISRHLTGIYQSRELSRKATIAKNAKGLDITVDFSLIDTQSLQVVAAFSAHGSGSDNRLSAKESEYVASNAKILRQMAVSLAEDAAVHLADQKFIKGSAIVSQNPKRRLDDDSTSLKVYKK